MPRGHKPKHRETPAQILLRLAPRMFPADLSPHPMTLDAREADGDGVLHNLLYGRELYPVRTLIDAGADVNLVGNQGYTPLHVAAWRNHPEAIELLLSSGARRDMRCHQGQTPSDLARSEGYREVLALLS